MRITSRTHASTILCSSTRPTPPSGGAGPRDGELLARAGSASNCARITSSRISTGMAVLRRWFSSQADAAADRCGGIEHQARGIVVLEVLIAERQRLHEQAALTGIEAAHLDALGHGVHHIPVADRDVLLVEQRHQHVGGL